MQDIPRLRIGIGRPAQASHDVSDWVLSRFDDAERDALHQIAFPAAMKELVRWADGVIEAAVAAGKCNDIGPEATPAAKDAPSRSGCRVS